MGLLLLQVPPRLRHPSSLETSRLLASGRVGRGRALLGSLLSVKPILGLTQEGKVEPVGKVVGKKRVLGAMIDAVTARVQPGASKVRFGVIHVAAPEVVAPVTAVLRERWGAHVEVLSNFVTPVIATHLGPGAWGIAYLVED